MVFTEWNKQEYQKRILSNVNDTSSYLILEDKTNNDSILPLAK